MIINKKTMFVLALLISLPARVMGQNWNLVIMDNALHTPVNQVNGVMGGTADLYATLFNFTGTSASDDGTGNPAVATFLDFGGLGFTLNPGQSDLDSRFAPDLRVPGWPQVQGSADGTTPGSSGYVLLGTFDLSGLAPGIYQEDFSAGAYPDDFSSTVAFADIHGTLTLRIVTAPTVPEPTPWLVMTSGCIVFMAFIQRRRHQTVSPSSGGRRMRH